MKTNSKKDIKMYKVLLLGDSISIGYRQAVRKHIENNGGMVLWPKENGKFASYTYRMLYDWNNELSGLEDIDVVYWNNGLWDVVRLFGDLPQTPLDIYEEYIYKTFCRIKKLCPIGKVIFATTTRVLEHKFSNNVLRLNKDIEMYNIAAKQIVEKKGGIVHDLYKITYGWEEELWEDATHFTIKAYNNLACEISDKIIEVQTKGNILNKRFKNLIKAGEKYKTIALYPYGYNGKILAYEIKNYLGPNRVKCIDNYCSSAEVYTYNEYKKMNEFNESLYVITTEKADLSMCLLEDLLRDGINSKNIYIYFKDTLLSYEALDYVLSSEKQTILDIGCGNGIHARVFSDAGKRVTAITASQEGIYTGNLLPDVRYGKFEDLNFQEKYDVVWASHILEHIRNIDVFLSKIKSVVKLGGIVAITVPAREKNITLSHVHQFNAGRLIRYLLTAGFDCSDIKILEYGFNLSVILPNVKLIPEKINLNKAEDGTGDFIQMDQVFNYLPKQISLTEINSYGIRTFNGDIKELNWYE